MVKLRDIEQDENREYFTSNEPDMMRIALESAGMVELLENGGHVFVETHDGDLAGVWYSTDSEPSEESEYEEIYP